VGIAGTEGKLVTSGIMEGDVDEIQRHGIDGVEAAIPQDPVYGGGNPPVGR
jgi:hypothetical protein